MNADDAQLEIAHVLFIDIVGYSKRLVNEQTALVRRLNDLVRATEQVQQADAAGKVIRIPTGDGMALAFFTSPEAPVRCAIELSKADQLDPKLELRMGIHSGPVDPVSDVNDRSNVAGAGINMAQRVMDCGDAGHILLSKRVAGDLGQYSKWQTQLHDLGEVEVKHGVKIGVVNFVDGEVGNAGVPEKIRRLRRGQTAVFRRRTIIWSFGGVAAVAAVVAAFWIQSRRTEQAHPVVITAPEKSIAVLPFENLSAEKENAYFADGVQDEILTDLAKIADLKVISRTSVMQYKSGTPRNLREIAQQLGVACVLEGSVQRAGGTVRVNAQLIDARTDRHLWAKTYDRDLADVFAIETELAQSIANELQAKLSPSEKSLIEEQPTQDLVAYDLYVRATPLIEEFRSGNDPKLLLQAEDLLNKAVARDPSFFLAYCWLSRAHDQLYLDDVDHTPARLALAKSAIDSAFRLKPDSGEAHLALAMHLYWGYFDFDHARAELEIARRTLPNNARIFQVTSLIDRRQGRWSDAVRNMGHAGELDPQNLTLAYTVAQFYFATHNYEQARTALDRVLALKPDDIAARLDLGGELEMHERGQTGRWHSTIEKILAADPAAAEDEEMKSARFTLALYERDFAAAERAAAALPEKI